MRLRSIRKKKKEMAFIICIFIIILLILGNLAKVMPAESLYAYYEKQPNKIVVHCSAITAFDYYKKYEVKVDKGKAYITAYYYAVPFLRSKGNGDFTAVLDLTEADIQEVFLLDRGNKYVKIPVLNK